MDPKQLAQQLRKPEGEAGIIVANNMNQGNSKIINLCIDELNVQDNDRVLEIGFGNGKHIPDIISKAKNVSFAGIDFSSTMVAEAAMLNKELLELGALEIKEAGVSSIPFPSDSFDRIITVNTIYFWPDREKDILEIKRVLKPGGLLCIGIRPRHAIEKLEFTRHGFTLFEAEEVEALLKNAGFKNVTHIFLDEKEVEFQGEKVKFIGICVKGTK